MVLILNFHSYVASNEHGYGKTFIRNLVKVVLFRVRHYNVKQIVGLSKYIYTHFVPLTLLKMTQVLRKYFIKCTVGVKMCKKEKCGET